MSIQATDLRKLVKIVRQYEVIYGGGISTSDAAVREECEGLVGLLESELGGKPQRKGGKAGKTAPLPSLVESRRKPKGPSAPRPLASRAHELATLTSSKSAGAVEAAKPAPKGKAEVKKISQRDVPGKKAVAKTSAKTATKTAAKTAVKATAPSAPPAEAAKPGSAAKPASTAKSTATTAPAGQRAVKGAEDEVYRDVRSRHAGAAKAAAERSDIIAGRADSDGAPGKGETRKRFAALHLFDAFQQNRLPKYGGFIVCIRYSENTGYAVIEIIGYGNMQDIYPEGETLVFKSVGCKLYALVEPSGYLLKSVEPVNRPSEQMVPYRFSELLHITTKRFQGIFVGRKPVFMPTSFSVLKPAGEDLAILFYDIADVYSNIQDFLIMIFRDRLGVPVPDSRKAAEVIARGIREFRIWIDEA